MIALTNPKSGGMIFMLSQKNESRDWRPDTSGAAATIAVFLCAKLLSSSLLCRAGRSSRKTGRCSYRYANFVQSGTHDWRLGVGFITLRDIIMKNQSFLRNQAKSSQSKYISLFNLIKRTPEGRRVICRNLTFSQASALVAEIPNVVVKFSRMEAAQ